MSFCWTCEGLGRYAGHTCAVCLGAGCLEDQMELQPQHGGFCKGSPQALRNDYAQLPEPPRTPYQAAVATLDEEIVALQKAIRSLEDHIAPVLSPPVPSAGDKAPSAPRTGAAAVDLLTDQAELLRTLRYAVNGIDVRVVL